MFLLVAPSYGKLGQLFPIRSVDCETPNLECQVFAKTFSAAKHIEGEGGGKASE